MFSERDRSSFINSVLFHWSVSSVLWGLMLNKVIKIDLKCSINVNPDRYLSVFMEGRIPGNEPLIFQFYLRFAHSSNTHTFSPKRNLSHIQHTHTHTHWLLIVVRSVQPIMFLFGNYRSIGEHILWVWPQIMTWPTEHRGDGFQFVSTNVFPRTSVTPEKKKIKTSHTCSIRSQNC